MRMDATDRCRWRVCLALAVCCAVYAVTAAGFAARALADPLTDDLAAGQSMIVGTPCAAPAPIMVLWRSGLTPAGAIDGGKVVGQASGVRINADGSWTLQRCEITLDPDEWAVMAPCARRRLVMHEVIHLALVRHTATGLMAASEADWDQVPVLGCPAVLVPVWGRVTDAVLARVPVGWQASCGRRRGLVIRCVADNGAVRGMPRTRLFRARLWDQAGSGFTVVRIKTSTRGNR